MPFPSSQPDHSGRSFPSSFSSAPFARSPPYSNQNHSQPPSFATPKPATSLPSPARDVSKLPPAAVNLRIADTPPLMSLPTPSSNFSAPSIMPNELNSTIVNHDENSSFHSPAEAKKSISVLQAFTPDTLQAIRESQESPCILRNITPSDFASWLNLYPNLDEADNARFEYDGFSERMIVKGMAGSVHDSLAIFFIRAVTDGLHKVGGDTKRSLQVCSNTEFHNFKGEYEDTNTRKAPDAYVKLAGVRGFPFLVAEVGWAEEMGDLMADARLWLLGTDRQTKIVIIVKFSEDTRAARPASTAPSSVCSDIEVDTDAGDPDDADPDAIPEPTEEETLIASINKHTRLGALTDSLLNLDSWGALAQPLVGTIAATFHVFRLDATDTITEDFVATVLPAPAPQDPNQWYHLDLAELYSPYPIVEIFNHYIPVVFDMAEFREDIEDQVPDMEGKRAAARAVELLKSRGLWMPPKPFAGARNEKRKRGEEGGAGPDGDEEKREKRAR